MSREYRGKKIVIWPSYIDSTIPRSMGRKIPLKDAVPNPSIEEIVRAAEELSLNPIVEDNPYPKLWWKYKQRVVVDKKYPKTCILRLIARKIKEYRSKK